jgi:hypothetical protein
MSVTLAFGVRTRDCCSVVSSVSYAKALHNLKRLFFSVLESLNIFCYVLHRLGQPPPPPPPPSTYSHSMPLLWPFVHCLF